MAAFRLAPLSSDLEESFWRFVKQDFCDYYFFIYDWLLQKDKTQIFLALKQESIAGLALIYQDSIIQLRGGTDEVRFMLDNVKLDGVEVQVPLSCEHVVAERFPSPKFKANITLMTIQRGGKQLRAALKPQKLGGLDAAEIAQLMNECYPEMWSGVTTQYVQEQMMDKENVWLGFTQSGKLVSFGSAALTREVSHVTWIATQKNWQNKGYATAVVSALVTRCLRKASTAIIYVMDNNGAAKSVYEKVGFKPYKSYVFLKT